MVKFLAQIYRQTTRGFWYKSLSQKPQETGARAREETYPSSRWREFTLLCFGWVSTLLVATHIDEGRSYKVFYR
jgi:hypothetical protein